MRGLRYTPKFMIDIKLYAKEKLRDYLYSKEKNMVRFIWDSWYLWKVSWKMSSLFCYMTFRAYEKFQKNLFLLWDDWYAHNFFKKFCMRRTSIFHNFFHRRIFRIFKLFLKESLPDLLCAIQELLVKIFIFQLSRVVGEKEN